VAVIGFMPGSASTMEREHGFQDEMRTKFPEVNIGVLQFCLADRAKPMAVTESVLASLFAGDESSCVGVAAALKSRQAKGVKMVAFDANDQSLADLRSGLIDSIVAQNPFKMGYEATRAVALKL
jgi:ribose transport system substrate-binding protein